MEAIIIALRVDLSSGERRHMVVDDVRERPWGERVDVVGGELGWWVGYEFVHAGTTVGGAEIEWVRRYALPEGAERFGTVGCHVAWRGSAYEVGGGPNGPALALEDPQSSGMPKGEPQRFVGLRQIG